jgi:hypothetical protein
MRIFGWLTLLICLGTTGDLVHDLAFEEPNQAADTQTTAEEPDNAAEHLLIPSQRIGRSSTDIVVATPPADLGTISTAVAITNHTALRATSSHYQPPPTRALFFSVPLRI